MIDPKLKSKIANTIAKYEEKCEKLHHEVSLLRTAMGQLLRIPGEIYVDLEQQLEKLQGDLSQNASPEVIVKKIDAVMEAISHLANQSKDSCVTPLPENRVYKDISRSLLSLIEHMKVPELFNDELYRLKLKLTKGDDLHELPELINQLNDLMVGIFSLEKKEFKGMLHLLTQQLVDVDNYLKFTSKSQKQAQKESTQLENGITKHLQNIQKQVDDSTSLEALTQGIALNLENIALNVKHFKAQEKKRTEAYEEKMQQLQSQLKEAERHSDDIQKRFHAQQKLVASDALTGLPNRMAYDQQLVQACHRSERTGNTLCLALADIDFFKAINDTHGHLAGDKVLKRIAQLLKTSIRKVDFVARYGGEEFVFLFENTAKEEAVVILNTLREKIAASEFIYHDKTIELTISFGLTSFVCGDDLETFFGRADTALYQAKRAGRNQVQMA